MDPFERTDIRIALLHTELHEKSNGVFSFFIYRAENNLKTDWISVTQIRTRTLLYDWITKIQQKYYFYDWSGSYIWLYE